MTPSRPYLMRAIYEWIVDNGYTPHLLVDATRQDVDAPLEYAEDGRLVLNVAPRAVQALQMGNELVSFRARFGGAPRSVEVPVPAVMAIYARENGQGMLLGEPEAEEEAAEGEASADAEEDGPTPPDGSGGRGSHLRVVK